MRRSRTQRKKLLAEINVVPYIDVMLVLLVIFMITAPLLTQGVNVSLPQASAKVMPPKENSPIIISVDRNGKYYLNISKQPYQEVTAQEMMTEVAAAVQASQQQNQQREVYVKGDAAVDYGKVVQAMVLLQKAGVANVGLVTQPSTQEK